MIQKKNCQREIKLAYIAVIVESLFDHVELPVLSGVISYTGTVQPVAIVAADVMIDL